MTDLPLASATGKLIAVIGDVDTVVGFLMAGIGEKNARKEANYFIVEWDTPVQDLADCMKRFLRRDDINIILITQTSANKIRDVMGSHTEVLPAVLEIPSKDCPYNPEQDEILKNVKRFMTSEDTV